MNCFVLDASVALRWLLASDLDEDASAVFDAVTADPGRFAVPELFSFETFSVLARHHPDPESAWAQGIAPLLTGGIHRHPLTQQLATDAMPFVRAGLTGYDATYASLAQRMDGLWLTYDKQAHRRIASHGVSYLLGTGVPAEVAVASGVT